MRAVNRRIVSDNMMSRHRTLDEAMELFLAAHRALEEGARLLLTQRGLGRAHQRILYLIARAPGRSVSDMLERLQVTKQALNTPLSELKRKGLVRAKRQPGNGRRKQLFLTPAGVLLEAQLSSEHRNRLAAAFRTIGLPGERRWREAMKHLANGSRTWAPLRASLRPSVGRDWARRSHMLSGA
ncbi:MAG: MarR family winged helix-turn-helix transcriptional regulator [SAR324 cluster bacterium]